MNEVKDGLKIELLRLGPPILNNNIWNLFEIDKIVNATKEEEDKKINKEKLSLSNEFSLSLPINNKKIYLGQNFKSYINISNNFKHTVTIISIDVDVIFENKNSNFCIYKNVEHITILPDSFFDFTTEFPVLFLEIFTVRCVVEYYLSNEKKKVKKNFSFICKNPLNLKTNIIQQNEKLFVEILLKNIEEDSIMLNELTLKDLNCEMIKSDELLHFSKGIHFFKQYDEFSVVFHLNDEKSKLKLLKSLNAENSICIEMKFFTMNGGKGINQYYRLKLNTDINSIKIYLKNPKEIFYLQNKIYKFELVFENNTDEDITLDVFIHNNTNTYIVNNFVQFDLIEKRNKVSSFFDVIFINPGLHFFNKISVYNRRGKKKIEYRNLFKVYVK